MLNSNRFLRENEKQGAPKYPAVARKVSLTIVEHSIA